MTETEELADAECDLERWWTLAAVHPLEAEASPLYDLLTLEEPGRWGEMEKKKASSWMRTALPYLNERDKRLFACDCAERVLGYFEKVFPTDLRPREALHVARAFANGEATLAQLTSANANAETANDVAFSEDHAASQAANAITLAADPFDTKAPMYAADAAADVADFTAKAYHRERSWQWRRLREYVMGKVPLGKGTKKSKVGGADDPRTEASDPNTSPERLLTLAENYPTEVLENTALPLLSLEDANFTRLLHGVVASYWMKSAWSKLSTQARELFAADCIEHVIGVYESVYPKEPEQIEEIWNAIDSRRGFARGKSGRKEWDNDRKTVFELTYTNNYAAGRVAMAASLEDPALAVEEARIARTRPDLIRDEALWQWERMQTYLVSKVGGARNRSALMRVSGAKRGFTKKMVEDALQAANGHQANAANILNTRPGYFSTLLQKFNIPNEWTSERSTRHSEAVSKGVANRSNEKSEARAEKVRQRWANFSREERAEKTKLADQWWVNMSKEERAAFADARHQWWVTLSTDEKERISRILKERFAALSPEIKAKAVAAMKFNNKKQKVGGGGGRGTSPRNKGKKPRLGAK